MDDMHSIGERRGSLRGPRAPDKKKETSYNWRVSLCTLRTRLLLRRAMDGADLLLEYFTIDALGRSLGVFTQGAHGQPCVLVLEADGECLTVAASAAAAALRHTRRSAPHALRPHLHVLLSVAQQCTHLLWEAARGAAEAAAEGGGGGGGGCAGGCGGCASTADGSAQCSASCSGGGASWALELCERLLAAAAPLPAGAQAPPLRWAPDSGELALAALRCWATGSDPLLPAPAAVFSLRPPPPAAARLPGLLPPPCPTAVRPALPALLLLTPAFVAMHVDPCPGREAVGYSWRLRRSAAAAEPRLDLFPFALAASGRLAWLRVRAGEDAGEAEPRAARIAALLRGSRALPLLQAAADAAPALALAVGDLDEAMGEGPHGCQWGSVAGSSGGGGLRGAAAAAARLLALGAEAAALARGAGGGGGGGSGGRVLPLCTSHSHSQLQHSLCSTVVCSGEAFGDSLSLHSSLGGGARAFE